MRRSILAVVSPLLVAGALEAAPIAVTSGDADAASKATTNYRHALPANGGQQRPGALTMRKVDSAGNAFGTLGRDRFPADLQYHGGAVVVTVQSHPIFVNTTATCQPNTCWGDPQAFLSDLANSTLIQVADQYVGSKAKGRYTLGASASVTVPTTPGLALTDADVQAIVHAVAAATGNSGYGHEFHVFLPPGQDECFDATRTVCYSPDNFATFFFCAYHSSTDFPDVGHVLYSVEPFQNVVGCHVRAGTPNGPLVDSTNNVLSHELIETITDPDGDAWWNSADNGLFGQEIADECSFIVLNPPAFDPSIFLIGKKTYAAQPEYANAQHVCTVDPIGAP